MLKQLEKLIDGKNVLILGFGKEGRSTYNLLNKIKNYKKISIADENDIKDKLDIEIHTGKNYIDQIKNYDIVFKSPGVVIPYDFDKGDTYITSQIEQFLIRYKDKVIGITGTKGKSTTSSLIYHILKNSNIDTILAGNIGIPVFDIIDNIKDDTKVVAELSSHQLEYCNASPHIAVFLNIYEEHLDHYKDFNAYFDAKKNIYKNQDDDDILFCIEDIYNNIDNIKSHVEVVDDKILPDLSNYKLIGKHNLLNISFAYKICKACGINDKCFKENLSTFEPLPHRLEYVGKKDGIKYYDDSISTAQESCIEAINSIKDIDTILIGGMDRGINYDKLIKYLSLGHVNNIICMYKSGERIYDQLKNNKNINIYYVEDLKSAVEKAKSITKSGKSCVLSPASASYGYFKNFEERGDFFKKYALD